MGILSLIEDNIGNVVEKPFGGKKTLDFPRIEISLKGLMESRKVKILDRIYIPACFKIFIDVKDYCKVEPFFEIFKEKLNRSLKRWAKEKDYFFQSNIEITFEKGNLKNNGFEIHIGEEKKDHKKADLIGTLMNAKTKERFDIYQNPLTLGRGEDCQIKINDMTVSRRHDTLYYENGIIYLKDLGSRSGTRLNHERISQKVLHDGDRISIGQAELIFLKNI